MENQTEVFDIAIWLSIAIGIAAIALWFNIKYRHINPKLNDIRSAIDWIKSNKSTDLQDLSTCMSENKSLAEAWQTFRRTLYPESNQIIATHKAAQHFNETIIDSGDFDIRFANAIPGYLLSTGLLFTFIGLLLALSAAVALSQSGDAGATSTALQGLLGAASFKFLTSITGLLSSILFSIALRKNLQNSRNLLDQLCLEIDSRLKYETTETITLRQMNEAAIHNQQLIAANKVLAENQNAVISQLMNSIGSLHNGINNNADHLAQHAGTFERSINHLLEESKISNAHFVNEMRLANQDNLNAIVENFVHKFNGETKSGFKEINQQLKHAQDNFSQITGNLIKAGQFFQQEMKTSGAEIHHKITEASAMLNESFGSSAHSMMKTTNNVGEILDSLHKVMANLYKGTEAILEANKNIAPVSERFEATTRDFVAVIPEITGLTNHFKKFYSIFSDFNTNMRSIDKNKINELSELVEFSRKSTELVKDYHASSLSINKELKESVEAFHDLMLDLDQGLKSVATANEPDKKWNQIN